MQVKRLLLVGVGGAAIILVAWWLLSRPVPQSLRFDNSSEAEQGSPFSYESYALALMRYVDDRGLVNYKNLKTNRESLDTFAAAIGRLDREVYEVWSDEKKIAFLINVYNALTLEAIISNYPIKPTLTASILYPSKSIRQIPGVWDKLGFLVMGREMTLDQIEHEMLRKEFNEPRIHFALVCAAMGCAQLRNEPYFGERLNDQLDEQARSFISNPQKVRIDRENGVIYLSSIFNWFGEDFIKSFGIEGGFGKQNTTERAVLHFVSRYVSAGDRAFLESGKYSIEYIDYDWSLNEQGDE